MKKPVLESPEQMPETPKMPVADEVMAEAAPIEEAPLEEAPIEAEAVPEDLQAKISELEAYKAANEESNQKIMDVLDAEPVLAKIIQDISMGATFREAIARHIDPEELIAMEGDPDFESWEKNRTSRTEEMIKRKQFSDELAANQEMTKAEIREFATENNMSQEQAVEFLGKIDEMLSGLYAGKIDRKTLAFLKKAVDADQMVADAKEEGEIAGRNAKIKETIAPAKVGDGLPKITASEDNPTPEPPKKQSYIDRLKNS